MGPQESKKDILLKRTQLTIAILAGLTTLIIGVYNVKKNVFAENKPGAVSLVVVTERGERLPQSRVELYNAQNELLTASETGSDGAFVKKELSEGGYILKVSRPGFTPEVASLRVEAKKTTDLQMALRAVPVEVKTVPAAPNPEAPSAIRSALEEVGASWIKKIATPKNEEATK